MIKDQPIRPLHNGILRFLFSEPSSGDSSPAIFLDRDGVINKQIFGGYVTEWSQFEFVDGIKLTLSVLVGDSESDLQAARLAQCRAILLAERNGHSLSDDLAAEPPITVHSAGEIAAGVRQLL